MTRPEAPARGDSARDDAARVVPPSLEGPDRDVKRRVHRRVLEVADTLGPVGGEELRLRVGELLREVAPLLPAARAQRVLDDLLDEISGLGPLEAVLADPEVSEVMLLGGGDAYVERGGELLPLDVSLEAAEVTRLVERVVAPLGLRLDRSCPLVEARLADGSRLHAVIPPLAPDGPCVTIRRFRVSPVPLSAFDPGDAAAFLEQHVAAGWNLLISGGTSSGKTTLCNALVGAVDPSERIVTIEETAELRLTHDHVVRLEARPPNAEGAGDVSVRRLVRAALRMRPDRIIVGEVRGGEALDMIQALNTGHDGSLSTVHAGSPGDALARLEVLALMADAGLPLPAIRAQVASSLDAVVQVARVGGARRIESVAEVRREGTRLAAVPLFDRGPAVSGESDVLRRVAGPTRPSRRTSRSGGCRTNRRAEAA